jgi:hypothetical protein
VVGDFKLLLELELELVWRWPVDVCVVDFCAVDFWLVDVLALVAVIPGRPKASPAAARMLAAVADAATDRTRARPWTMRLLSVMA